jgi:hypothetical protein
LFSAVPHYVLPFCWLVVVFYRPCVGELGSEPVEVEMFDYDNESKKIGVTLFPNEILYIPFTYMTLIPFIPTNRKLFNKRSSRLMQSHSHDNRRREERGRDGRSSSRYEERKDNRDRDSEEDDEIANEELVEDIQRIIDVKIISGSHGHLVAILRAHLHPRPFITNRVLRFHEYENSIAKRKIRLIGIDDSNFSTAYPGRYMTEMKYIHCVENTLDTPAAMIRSNNEGGNRLEGSNSRVLVEWGSKLQESSFPSQDDHIHSLDMLIRYRCLDTSTSGMFYLLLYNDPYQSELHEVKALLFSMCLLSHSLSLFSLLFPFSLVSFFLTGLASDHL